MGREGEEERMQCTVEDGTKAWVQRFVWICISLGFISYSAAFSHGGSFTACSDMRPKHIRAQPQNQRRNHVTIHTNRSFYLPGENVPVTIRSTRDFMGFFLQARRISDDQVAGSFVFIPPGSKLLRCFDDGDTVTHSDKSLKRNLSFVWKSPDHPVGDIKFFVSVVQSYFVYWARIESTIVLGHIPNRISESQKPEVSNMETSSVTNSKHKNTSAHTDSPSLGSSAGAKPPELLLYNVTGKTKHILPDITSTIAVSLQSVTPSTSNSLGSTTAESSLEFHASPAQTSTSQNRTSNHSLIGRTQYTPRSLTTLCSSCQEENEMVSKEIILSPRRPTSLPDSFAWFTLPPLPTQETFQEPIKVSLQNAQIHPLSPSTKEDKKHKATKELSANFLQQPESAASDTSIEVNAESTSPWVTRSIQKFGVPGRGGENKSRGMQLAMTQLGILLGCSVVLGMALAAGLRCIHAQYCHKRTEVSFSEPDENVITLKENGEMMHFKQIRENSFVLVQAEYNWITPAVSIKTQ
ncbi:reelin domain-containing protein 1 [Mixophyes fleayi]|uniref:reelin domain-containing protein 1 n=1 Tax=Mixophyes fleayi TaxID=3061075 RepID=UPI003F4E3E53